MKVTLDGSACVYAGQPDIEVTALPVYSSLVMNFLDELSKRLRKMPETSAYPDVKTFSFWCRKANVEKMKQEEYMQGHIMKGRGLAFHITPSNVPVNFAFSFAFGLLSGNANIVRVPSHKFPQVELICSAIEEVWKMDEYQELRKQNLLLSYDHQGNMTEEICKLCDVRMIWGGDETIATVRHYETKPKCVDIVFADRYSLCVLQAEELLQASDEKLAKMALAFYHDTYEMDQNACSTPHLILFQQKSLSKDLLEKAKDRFWQKIHELAREKYLLSDIKVCDKYVDECLFAASLPDSKVYSIKDNYLNVIKIKNLPEDVTKLRGRFGLFFDYTIQNLNEILPFIQQNIQTITYEGISKEEWSEFVCQNNLIGIDRIVPLGEALDMNVYWDGYSIIRNMSRIINIH